MPEVSILIPTYNSGKFIDETIKSALCQTYKNFEIILVDNASTDNTWELISNYCDKYPNIRAYRNNKNIGPIRNWMRCIDKASGKYGKILWSDDLLDSIFLEKTVPIIDSDENIGFVYTPAVIFGKKGQKKIFYNYLREGGIYSTDNFIKGILHDKDFPNSPACALFRMIDLKNNLLLTIPNRFNSDASQHAIGNDLLIFLLTARRYTSFAFVNEPMAHFRIHPDSITIGSKKQKLVLNYDIAKAYFVDNYLTDIAEIEKFNAILWLHNKIYKLFPSIELLYYKNNAFKIDFFFLIRNMINPRIYIKRLYRKLCS